MALPVLTKTWQFVSNGVSSVNMAIPALGVAVNNRRVLRTIKNTLIGFASNPWTVRYSCDGVTAGTAGDGVDRWVVDTDVRFVQSSGAHGWMVLRQTGIATNFEILFDLVTAPTGGAATNGTQMNVLVSQSAGFTGGTTTARPTATDEAQCLGTTIGGAWTALVGNGAGTDVASRLSVAQSSDGQFTWIWGASGGAQTFMMLFVKPANPVTGWTNPFYATTIGGATTVANLCTFAGNGRMRALGTVGNMAMGCETAAATILPNEAAVGAVANDISGEWPMLPISLSCNTVGIKGRHGTIPDLWFGSPSVAIGDTYPDATNQFVQIGALIFPWNGGPVNLT